MPETGKTSSFSDPKTTFSNDDFEAFLEGCNIPKLGETLKTIAKEEFARKKSNKSLTRWKTESHLVMTVSQLNFIKPFYKQLEPMLLEYFNSSYNTDSLPVSQTKAVITLIEKKDYYRTDLKNWRLII